MLNYKNLSKEEKFLGILILIVIVLLGYNFWSASNFTLNIGNKGGNNVELRLYYAQWCGHSVALINNGWKKAKQILENDGVAIKEIDCDVDSNVCSTSGVSGFPTIKLFKNGNEIEYVGDRTENSIVQFVKNNC